MSALGKIEVGEIRCAHLLPHVHKMLSHLKEASTSLNAFMTTSLENVSTMRKYGFTESAEAEGTPLRCLRKSYLYPTRFEYFVDYEVAGTEEAKESMRDRGRINDMRPLQVPWSGMYLRPESTVSEEKTYSRSR